MTTHLALRDDDHLCLTEGRWLAKSTDLHAVTCKRCLRALEDWRLNEPSRLRERAFLRYQQECVEAVGFADVISFIGRESDSAYGRMMLGILGSLAVYLAEQGYQSPAARILATVEVAA